MVQTCSAVPEYQMSGIRTQTSRNIASTDIQRLRYSRTLEKCSVLSRYRAQFRLKSLQDLRVLGLMSSA